MPPRDTRQSLSDIVQACDVIALCTAGRTADAYAADVIIRSAVERQFEIIGEAMRRIVEAEPGLTLRLPEAREVIDFRNLLAHGYHLVDHAEVWSIVTTDVPPLRRRAAEILAERTGGS
jgi:uncharacterized protein with HEPN domain